MRLLCFSRLDLILRSRALEAAVSKDGPQYRFVIPGTRLSHGQYLAPHSAGRRRHRRPSVSRRGAWRRTDPARFSRAAGHRFPRAALQRPVLQGHHRRGAERDRARPHAVVAGPHRHPARRRHRGVAQSDAAAEAEAVVGFGGYPTLPPLLAARCSACPASFTRPMRCSAAPTVFCRAASARSRPRCPACSIAIRRWPARPPRRYADASGDPGGGRGEISFCPKPGGPLRLLVVGGSQGARVMADIVPPAIERLEPALWSRLMLTQQVREEDMARVRAVYDRLKINAELAPFFTDLPARLASQPSGGLALRRRHRGRTRRHRPARRSWCRCPARSTRTSSPMPACWRRPAARFGIPQSGIHAGPAGGGNLRVRRRARSG